MALIFLSSLTHKEQQSEYPASSSSVRLSSSSILEIVFLAHTIPCITANCSFHQLCQWVLARVFCSGYIGKIGESQYYKCRRQGVVRRPVRSCDSASILRLFYEPPPCNLFRMWSNIGLFPPHHAHTAKTLQFNRRSPSGAIPALCECT